MPVTLSDEELEELKKIAAAKLVDQRNRASRGGRSRAMNLTTEQRREISRRAAILASLSYHLGRGHGQAIKK